MGSIPVDLSFRWVDRAHSCLIDFFLNKRVQPIKSIGRLSKQFRTYINLYTDIELNIYMRINTMIISLCQIALASHLRFHIIASVFTSTWQYQNYSYKYIWHK